MPQQPRNVPAKPVASFDRTVTPEMVAKTLGITVADITRMMGSRPWPVMQYRVIADQAERDELIRGVLERIDFADLRVVGGNDNTVWERGWGEILDHIKTKGFDPVLLFPQYLHHHHIMRFNGEYIDAGTPQFACDYDQLLRQLIFAHYLKDAKKVVELGCGTGTSQLRLTELLPHAKLVASDWSRPSQDIIRAIAAHTKRDIKPVCFNMLTMEGWDELEIDKDSTVLTVHALEQLGAHHEALLDKLIAAKPAYCVHIEPIAEFYDNSTLFDYLALRYHKRRNYLDGFLTRLRNLAQQKKVEIMDERRIGFGDRYHEAYGIVKWRVI